MPIRLPDINDELDAALKALHSTVERVMRLEDRVKSIEDTLRPDFRDSQCCQATD